MDARQDVAHRATPSSRARRSTACRASIRRSCTSASRTSSRSTRRCTGSPTSRSSGCACAASRRAARRRPSACRAVRHRTLRSLECAGARLTLARPRPRRRATLAPPGFVLLGRRDYTIRELTDKLQIAATRPPTSTRPSAAWRATASSTTAGWPPPTCGPPVDQGPGPPPHRARTRSRAASPAPWPRKPSPSCRPTTNRGDPADPLAQALAGASQPRRPATGCLQHLLRRGFPPMSSRRPCGAPGRRRVATLSACDTPPRSVRVSSTTSPATATASCPRRRSCRATIPTLLFTNAGMNQFKDLFLGKERREYRRATTSQKCMRVSGKHNDLDNVGPSLRHHTFFEMLGNFSFGDYFKTDAIPFAWELLTKVWGLSTGPPLPHRLQGRGRHPARRRGVRIVDGARAGRRASPRSGLAENFWQMGETGPCGRCSEIHYFRGADVPCPEPVCRGVECSCERYVEVWNNVFMEFDRDASGHAHAAARAVDRHGHGPRAHHGGHPGQALELRHGPLHADPRRHRRARRAAATTTRRAWPTIPTSRCGSSPITCAR